MEPLLDLSGLEDWDDYYPNTEGYVPPLPSELKRVEIMANLECLSELETRGSILGDFSIPDAPNPCISVGGQTLGLPFNKSASRAFPGSLQGAPAQFHCVEASAIQLRNERWHPVLETGVRGALRSMKVVSLVHSRLANLAMASAPAGRVLHLPQSASKDHFATVLVFLPFDASLSATIEAQHGGESSFHDLDNAPKFSTHFIVLYAGIDQVLLKTFGGPVCFLTYHICAPSTATKPSLDNLSRSRPEIALALAAWRYALQSSARLPGGIPEEVMYYLYGAYDDDAPILPELCDGDDLVVQHLAPAAKYYGFDITVANSNIELSCQWEHYREYKEYDNDYDAEDYCADDHGGYRASAEWTFMDLNGNQTEHDDALVKKLNRAVKNDGGKWTLNWPAEKSDDEDREIEIVDQSCYTDTLRLSYTQRASVIIISPSEGYGP